MMKNKHGRGTLIPLYSEIQSTGRDLAKKIKLLVIEGNDHRLVVRKSEERTLFEIPFMPAVLIGTGIVLFAPPLAAL